MQRKLSFAIVDEVDSILIDEARTPLIISGPAEESTELYIKINALIPRLVRQKEENGPGDYAVDEKTKQATLTEDGHQKVEELMAEIGLLREGESLYDATNIRLMHHLNAALRAHSLYKRDVEYIVRQGEVIIVDEFTGRTMPGRRWSDGLHQAVEAKEGVKVREENQTVASITFQNYFRLYSKLSGMTGTADTEAFEFQQIYGLEVVVIPTHKPMIRKDKSDLVFLSEHDKFQAILEDIQDCVKRGQPVLVGTTSIETSERLAKLLQGAKIPHEVLNAKQHEREAHIVAEAGRPGAITIATNMAGRGTDIVLGGSPQTQIDAIENPNEARAEADPGRLAQAARAGAGRRRPAHHRHRAPRIAAHRQSVARPFRPPGRSRLEPFLLVARRQFDAHFRRPDAHEGADDPGRHEGGRGHRERHADAPDRARAAAGRAAQLRRPQAIAGIRRRRQRSAPRDLPAAHRPHGRGGRRRGGQGHPRGRGRAAGGSVRARRRARGAVGRARIGAGHRAGLRSGAAHRRVGQGRGGRRRLGPARTRSSPRSKQAYDQKEINVGAQVMRYIEKEVMLRTLDQHWREHLAAMDYMRQGIFLRSYAQKNPKQEYKREAFELFSAMLDRIKFDTVTTVSKIQVRSQAEIEREELERQQRLARALQVQHAEAISPIQAAPGPQDGGAGGEPPTAGGNVMEIGAAPERPGRRARSCAPCPRSAATSRAPAARAASTSTATAPCSKRAVELPPIRVR